MRVEAIGQRIAFCNELRGQIRDVIFVRHCQQLDWQFGNVQGKSGQ